MKRATRQPVPCDACGQVIGQLADAVVTRRYDDLGRCVGISLDHRACAAQRREGADDRAETLTELPAADLIKAEGGLRSSARAHWASASRVIAKVRRLAPGRAAGVPC